GWHLPWIENIPAVHDVMYGTGPNPFATGWIGVLIKFAVYWGKVIAFLFFYMWVRWTLPRFRFDQLMNLAWRGMIPIALAGLLITAFVVFLEKQSGLGHARIWMLVGNLALIGVTLAVLSRR